MRRSALLLAALLAWAGAPAGAAAAAAQTQPGVPGGPGGPDRGGQAAGAPASADAGRVLHGVVVDPVGNPAAGVPIVLHRVIETGGSVVEQVASGGDGRFTMSLPDGEPPDALYFVAARYEGELYIGPTLRPPFPAGSEYVVQVGIDATSAARIARGVDADAVFVRPPASPWRWGIAATVLIALVGFTAALVVRARGPDARRRLLIRVAELDEAHAAPVPGDAHADAAGGLAEPAPAGPDAGEYEDYRAQRADLVDRLRAMR